ncbi:hypothetical protein AB838_16545 [Rhodobacteraceae bacterium (ex Bugula neritina AB1)]|nr:hypothetical protein AB838_16545 [Rhodobacteraceae bacterium (ex Bugula neritina AB1)]
MRRLVLHIGSHKTGTTTLQSALMRGKRQGLLGGWSYLHAGLRVDFNTLVGTKGMGAGMHTVLKWPFFERRMEHAAREGMQDVVISSEMLFWLDDATQIAALAERLRLEFDEIRIVAYLRRQDQLALSHRKQVVMGRAAYQFYGAQLQALPRYAPHMLRYFDYAGKLAKWEQIFGADSITVRRFGKADLKGGDTVADFWSILGLAPPQGLNRKNVAWSRAQLLAGLWLRQRGYPSDAFVPLVKQIEDPEPLLPSQAQAQAFLAPFLEQNAVLAQRYDPAGPENYFGMDVSRYPEASNLQAAPPQDLAALETAVQARMAEQGLEKQLLNPADGPAGLPT